MYSSLVFFSGPAKFLSRKYCLVGVVGSICFDSPRQLFFSVLQDKLWKFCLKYSEHRRWWYCHSITKRYHGLRCINLSINLLVPAWNFLKRETSFLKMRMTRTYRNPTLPPWHMFGELYWRFNDYRRIFTVPHIQ